MRGATALTLQRLQILCLPHKMTRMIDSCHIYETSFTMRRATGSTLQPHQILRLPRKNFTLKFKRKLPKTVEASLTMRCRFEHDPTIKLNLSVRKAYFFPPQKRILYWKLQHFSLRLSIQIFTKCCACHQKWHSNITKLRCPCHKKRHSNITKYCACHEKVTLQHHQMLHPATKSDTPTSPNAAPAPNSDTATSPNTAPAMKSNTPTSPNTAPATQNDSHDWSCSHMKRHLQWATGITLQPHQIVPLPRKMTFQNMKKIYSKTDKSVIYNGGRFENDPMIRAWTRYLAPARSPRLLLALWRRIL